jgi:hypothetical protein
MASLKEVGKKLCDLCNQGKFDEAMEQIYSKDAVQIEAATMPGCPSRETKGLDAIKKKAEQWNATTTVHACKVGKPQYHGDDRFACTMWLDCTSTEGPMKGRHQIEEICVYTVKNGKITKAEFFYDMGA